jgi:hypothetical protein
VKGKGEGDLIGAIKLLDAGETEKEYLNAYNFTLEMATHYYGDRRAERRSGTKSLTTYRPMVTNQ